MHQDANVPLTYLQHKGHSSTCKFNDMKYRIFSLFYIAIVFVTQMAAEDGSHLWLRLPVNAHAEISAPRQSPTLNIAVEELQQAWKGAPVRLVIQKDKQLQAEGFRIRHEDNKITLTSPPKQDCSMPPITCSGCKRPDRTWLRLKQQRIPPTTCASSTIGTIWTAP